MKKIAEQYGSLIVAGIVFLFFVAVFTSGWLNDGLKRLTVTPTEDYSSYVDTDMTHEIMTTPKPEVALLNHSIRKGSVCNLNRAFTVLDHMGNLVNYVVVELADSNGTDILAGNNPETYIFHQTGNYMVSIRAIDSLGIQVYKKLVFPVQAG